MKRVIIFFVLLVAIPIRLIRSAWRRAGIRERGARIASTVEIRLGFGGSFNIASGASVGHGSLLIAEAGSDKRPVHLTIGPGSAINEYCNLRAAGGSIVIGRQCILAQFVTIVATNHSIALGHAMIEQPWESSRRGVKIGDDVWIGANAVILPGTTIHDGAVVGAGAVITRDVPAGEIWAGVPAKRISARRHQTTIHT